MMSRRCLQDGGAATALHGAGGQLARRGRHSRGDSSSDDDDGDDEEVDDAVTRPSDLPAAVNGLRRLNSCSTNNTHGTQCVAVGGLA